MAHTPGPWKVHPANQNRFLPLCSVRGRSGEMTVAEGVFTDDDARLIAAAPQLLEALELLEGAAEEYAEMGRDFPTHGVASVQSIATEAIKLVKGE